MDPSPIVMAGRVPATRAPAVVQRRQPHRPGAGGRDTPDTPGHDGERAGHDGATSRLHPKRILTQENPALFRAYPDAPGLSRCVWADPASTSSAILRPAVT